MTYQYKQIHDDIQCDGGFKKLIVDGDVVLFHSDSLSVISTGVSEEEYDLSAEDLKEFEHNLPDTSAGKKLKVNVDISAVALNVAEQCNLRCTYCYAGEGDYGKNDKMNFTVAKSVLDQFVGKKDNFTIVFFGGEPLLNFALVQEVIEYTEKTFPSTKFHFRMTSNGLLMTQKIIDYLKTKNVNLTISYDGKTAQKKQRLNINKQENERDFAKERIKKFENDLKKLAGFKIRSTVTSDMIDAFSKDLYQIKKDLPFNLGFNRVATKDEKYKYSLEDAVKLMNQLEKVVDSLLEEGLYNEVLSLDNIGGHLRIINSRQFKSMTCGAGVNYLSVSTDGSFYLCHRFTEDKEEKIGSIETGLDLESLEAIQNHRQAVHEPCNGCWMKSICRGGCFHENKMQRDTKHKPDPVFCYMQDRTIKMGIKAILTIKEKSPDLLKIDVNKMERLTGR